MPSKLPVIELPRLGDIKLYFRGDYALERDYPDFANEYETIRDHYIEMYTRYPYLVSMEGVVFGYMDKIERQYPEGYILLTDSCREQIFDIPMRNARVVMLGEGYNPLRTLNHGVSRLICKAPVLLIGKVPNEFQTGQIVNFECDGKSYSLT